MTVADLIRDVVTSQVTLVPRGEVHRVLRPVRRSVQLGIEDPIRWTIEDAVRDAMRRRRREAAATQQERGADQ